MPPIAISSHFAKGEFILQISPRLLHSHGERDSRSLIRRQVINMEFPTSKSNKLSPPPLAAEIQLGRPVASVLPFSLLFVFLDWGVYKFFSEGKGSCWRDGKINVAWVSGPLCKCKERRGGT